MLDDDNIVSVASARWKRVMKWEQLNPIPRQAEAEAQEWEQSNSSRNHSSELAIKNHTTTYLPSRNELWVFGGYDGQRNHNSVHAFSLQSKQWSRLDPQLHGSPPPGRNGHTATLANQRLFIVGGWLGAGPWAAQDMHVLDIKTMTWLEPPVYGTPPGPCNMHTADYVEKHRAIYVFRGGDGREYLNDLHTLHVDTYQWSYVEAASGIKPVPRANHSSAVFQHHLIVFGGWDGTQRLNDIHLFDTDTLTWSSVHAEGILPHPRAGMTLTSLRDQIFLFGGSGQSAKCFNDLHILDPHSTKFKWLNVVTVSDDQLKQPLGRYPSLEMDVDATEGGDQANPNDHSSTSTTTTSSNPNAQQDGIVVHGTGPGRRAGHTCTAVQSQLFVLGGSYGNDYLSSLYVLDTDPKPRATISSRHSSSTQRLQQSLPTLPGTSDFSDVTLIVEGRSIPAHRVILSSVSERFRAMFASGFCEATQKKIIISSDIRYEPFFFMIKYLYGGCITEEAKRTDHSDSYVELFVDLLMLADQFMLDHLKEQCEQVLEKVVNGETVECIQLAAERANAQQLKAICNHFLRNHNE